MLPFYAELFARAIWFLPSSLGSNALGLVWPVVIVLCGEIIACFVYGWRAMISKWKNASLIGLAALGICYTLLFLWCGLRLNYYDHLELETANARLKSDNGSATSHENIAVLRAQSECSKTLGANETLTRQNRDQQNTINNCQNQALTLIAPKQLRFSVKIAGLGIDESGPQGRVERTLIIVSTNKTVDPVLGTLKCDQEFHVYGWNTTIDAHYLMTVANERKSLYEFPVEINTPAWTPDNYLVFASWRNIPKDNPKRLTCDFSAGIK